MTRNRRDLLSPRALAALKAGASGVLDKDSSQEKIIAAIRKLVAGREVIDPKVRQALECTPPLLTPRQAEALKLAAKGFTNKGDLEDSRHRNGKREGPARRRLSPPQRLQPLRSGGHRHGRAPHLADALFTVDSTSPVGCPRISRIPLVCLRRRTKCPFDRSIVQRLAFLRHSRMVMPKLALKRCMSCAASE